MFFPEFKNRHLKDVKMTKGTLCHIMIKKRLEDFQTLFINQGTYVIR